MPGEDGKGIGLARVYTLDGVNRRRDAKVEKLRMEEEKKKDKKDKAAAKKLGKKAAPKTIRKKIRGVHYQKGWVELHWTLLLHRLILLKKVPPWYQLRRVTFREGDDSFSNEEEEQDSLEDSDSGFEINDFSVVLPFVMEFPRLIENHPH